jgi:hypothetical protein
MSFFAALVLCLGFYHEMGNAQSIRTKRKKPIDINSMAHLDI